MGLKEQTGTVSHFVVIQYQNGTLEILPLANDCDPVQTARERSAFLVGITASRSRAEFILSRERLKRGRQTRIKVNRFATRATSPALLFSTIKQESGNAL